jgi:Uma2 family endonuclease
MTALLAESRIHTFTREEYYAMWRAEVFCDKCVELIEGCVIDMGPMGSLHGTAIALVECALRETFSPSRFFIRIQCPLAVSDISEPEPDIAVIAGAIRDYVAEHPKTAVLVVEVSDTTLGYDRTVKANLYAKAGIPEYWVLNIAEKRLEAYRTPASAPQETFGFHYADKSVFGAGDRVRPLLASSEASVDVSELLP